MDEETVEIRLRLPKKLATPRQLVEEADYADAESTEPKGLRDELTGQIEALLAEAFSSPVLARAVIARELGISKPSHTPPLADCSIDQLHRLLEFAKMAADRKWKPQA